MEKKLPSGELLKSGKAATKRERMGNKCLFFIVIAEDQSGANRKESARPSFRFLAHFSRCSSATISQSVSNSFEFLQSDAKGAE